ncbi:purine-nucleoside phosphorylase [Ferrovibrio sp.]|uniref:purine-nucleoside phosphorylase n=1 Tax=Ferrovibrio sp. TaxID=1917215 RepID=UPI003512C960
MDDVTRSIAAIRAAAPDFRPQTGMVLGSGLGAFADTVQPVASISYADLPGFPRPGVGGHAGRLLLGQVGPVPVAIMQGRSHYYEHGRPDGMRIALQTLQEIGCETLLLTNAAGSLRAEMPPGSIMLITDHINFTGVSPLFGESGDRRFVDMVDAYDPGLRAALQRAAASAGITLQDGIYMWFCGPNFETPAEIRAAKFLGADAVGMSTVPEVILARYLGMRVAALSIITNAGAGLDAAPLSHQQTMAAAGQAADGVRALLETYFAGQR